MSKAPDDADALLLQLRTLKWQAVSVLASSKNRLAREDAAADFATMDAWCKVLGNNPGPEVVKAIKRKLDSLAAMRDHEPNVRAAGRH